MLPPLVTELTLEQGSLYAAVKFDIAKLSRQELEEQFMSILRQKMIADTNFKQLLLHNM